MKTLKLVHIPKTASTYLGMNFSGCSDFFEYHSLDTLPSNNITLDGNLIEFKSVGHAWNYPTQIGGWNDWLGKNFHTGRFNDVDTFELNESDILLSVVRNPFDILFSIFNYNWGKCREYHKLTTEWEYTVEDFQKFVDIYLDRNKVFFAPTLRRSMFSQLKDINGNWLINDESIILRFENFEEDFNNLLKRTDITLVNEVESKNKSLQTKPCKWYQAYRSDQVTQLNYLWKDDLEYFGYSYKKPTKKKNKTNGKPRIALCFSGHLRDLFRTHEYWSKLVNEYEMDVYASFWDIENQRTKDLFTEFKGIYKPENFEIESYSNFEESTMKYLRYGITPPNNLHQFLRESTKNFGFLPMWYKVWRANLLTKTSDVDYDIVIRARTDTYFENLTIEKNDLLNVPQGRVKTPLENSEGVSDLFAYGRPDIMDYYSTCFFNIMEHVNKGFYMVPHEYFLRTHLDKVDMNIRFMDVNTTITRTSKGANDELFCNGVDMGEEIFPSNFFSTESLSPNSEVKWKSNKKLKF